MNEAVPEGPSIVILKEEAGTFMKKKVLHVSGNSKAGIERLKGKTVLDLMSWGKHFLICFKGFYVRIHLMMFGSYRINERKESSPRISLTFTNGELNFYACALRIIDGSPAEHYDWSVDTMSDQWDHRKALIAIHKNRKSIISDVLLDQNLFAGVGNIIKVESLFICQVHPEATVRDIPEKKLDEVARVTRDYCFDFYRWKKNFELRKHWQIYRKSVCPRCGLKVKIKYIGKTNRRTFYCDNCQFLKRKDFKKAELINGRKNHGTFR